MLLVKTYPRLLLTYSQVYPSECAKPYRQIPTFLPSNCLSNFWPSFLIICLREVAFFLKEVVMRKAMADGVSTIK